MNSLEFFNLVLPAGGYRCAFTVHETIRRHKKFETNAELADYLQEEDALGHTAYYACSSYRTSGPHRTRAEVFQVQDLWVDWDFKGFANEDAAHVALNTFIADYNLTSPLTVYTGGGLHVHWPLAHPLNLEEWQPYADALANAARSYPVDAGVTSDAARVLRPPGTKNLKYSPPFLVHGDEYSGEKYGLDVFRRLTQSGVKCNVGTRPRPQRPGTNTERHERSRDADAIAERHAPNQFSGRNIQTNEAAGRSERNRDADRIAERCAQWRYIRDEGGGSDYLPWAYVLQGLTFCDEGRDIAHKWSQRSRSYDEGECDRKFDSWEGARGPISCASFGRDCGDRCAGCSESVTSPIHLGDRQPTKRDQVVYELPVQSYDELLTFKDGRSLYKGKPISSDRLELVRIAKAERTNDSYDCYELTLPHEPKRSIMVSARQACTGEGVKDLRGKGANVLDTRALFAYIVARKAQLRELGEDHMSYEQFGWKGDNGFLLGTELYKSGRVEGAFLSDELATRARYIVKKGTLQGWQAAANELLAVGNEIQAVALLASFASVLMRFLSQEGGAVVALISREGGRGKSTALDMAASVWGEKRALEITVNDTLNARISMFGLMHNLPVLCDEFTNKDPAIIREQIETFNVGSPKSRVDRTGELIDRNFSWQQILIVAANQSVNDLIASQKASEACATRVMELYITKSVTGLDFTRGDVLRRQLAENCGHAGELFIRYLTDPSTLEILPTLLNEEYEDIKNKYAFFKTEERFMCRALATMSIAGLLLGTFGILETEADRIIAWTAKEIADVNAERPPEPAVAVLAEYLSEMTTKTLLMAHEVIPGERGMIVKVGDVKPLEVLVRRNLKSANPHKPATVLIESRHLGDWLTKRGYKTRYFVAELEKAGLVLDKAIRKCIAAGCQDYSLPAVTCIELNAELLYHDE